MAKGQIGLGVLELPSTFITPGFVPDLTSLIAQCVIITITGLIIGNFRHQHPAIHSIGDASILIFGKWVRGPTFVMFWLLYVFCSGSAFLGFSVGLNTLSEHAQCNILYAGIAAIISLIFGVMTRTLKWMTWFGYVGLASIVTAIWITAIACLARDRPAAAPLELPINKEIRTFMSFAFSDAMLAVSTHAFALGGTLFLFTLHAEMRNPFDYRKSLLLAQAFICAHYIVLASLIYGKVGIHVTSPALASAGSLFEKKCYGIALPGLIYAGLFQAHIAAKYAFVRILWGSKHLQSTTMVHWVAWTGLLGLAVTLSFVIAESIPFFGDLIGLIGAFLMPHFCIIIPCCMYLYSVVEGAREAEEEGEGNSPREVLCNGRWYLASIRVARSHGAKQILYVFLAHVVIILGLFLFGGGTYGAIQTIINSYAQNTVGSAFSCADNS